LTVTLSSEEEQQVTLRFEVREHRYRHCTGQI